MAAVAWCLTAALPSVVAAQSPPCVRLRQSVADEDTRIALPNAQVTATWRAGNGHVAARTDSTGTAVVCVPIDVVVLVRVEYGNRMQSRETVFTREPGIHTALLDARSSYVRGRVVDELTGHPINQAIVRIAHSNVRALTDANGAFAFERLPLGNHTLALEHIAYAGHRILLRVGEDDIDALIRMAPAAIPLEPVVVTAFSRRLESVGFYERRRRGIGTFIDRKRIDQMNVNAASDLLRHVPGVRLVPQSRTRANQPLTATVGSRGNCRYVFIVDGTRTLSDFEMDNIAGPAMEGVEIYSGMADVPASFKAHTTSVAGSTVCGVVVMWTRNSR